MKDVNYYLDKASKLDIGEEMSVNVSEGDGGWIRKVRENRFDCYESTGYGSNIFNYGIRTFDELGAFIGSFY
jgi:hypothetical protein